MDIVKKIFRNPASDILFMIGLVIACVILINISDLASKISVEEENFSRYEYSSLYDKEVKEEAEQEVIKCFDEYKKGNIYFTHHVHVNKEWDSVYTYVLLAQNEKLKLNFKEGGYDEEKMYTNAVIIGESLEQYIVNKSGEMYIELDKQLYNVIGILENNMSAQKDTTIYALWDTMSEDRKEQWIKLGLCSKRLLYESDISDFAFSEEAIKIINDGNLHLSYRTGGIGTHDDENEAYVEINRMLLSIGLVFSMFTCFSVSYLWLMNRRKELAVRIAHGYCNKDIFKLLFRDTMYLIIPTFIISIIVQWLYSLFVDSSNIFEGEVILKLVVVFGGILMVVLTNTVYLMYSMRKFKAVMINEEK